jgi:hypothetical protein
MATRIEHTVYNLFADLSAARFCLLFVCYLSAKLDVGFVLRCAILSGSVRCTKDRLPVSSKRRREYALLGRFCHRVSAFVS